MAKIRLTDLYDRVESALVALGIGWPSVMNYRRVGFHRLKHYFDRKGCSHYSRKLANEFLSDSLKAYKCNHFSESQYQRIRKVVALLDEYNNTGAIKWGRLPNYNTPSFTCKNFEKTLAQYVSDININEKYSLSTVITYRKVIKQFLHYLEEQGHRKICCLTRKIVCDYIPVIAKRRSGSMPGVIQGLKSFLEYLYENKYIASELVSVLHGHPAKRKKHFTGFSREEANSLIASVPNDTNLGKRNIAIFTLAESTGLRSVDVANLKLSDIDWRKKTISIIQHKTGRPLILPLENCVGDALAEYILNGRPESDSPFIFLSANSPIRPVCANALSKAVSKYIKLSGIGNNLSFRKGFHGFRRGIGTWLLEAKLPLSIISEILGHGHINSAKPYLSTDHERLRECSIGLEGIEVRKGLFE